MAKSASPATQGYSAPGMGKKAFKSMSLSRQGSSIKATHQFVNPMHDNEHYLFGEGEQQGLMNHISKHLGFTKLTAQKKAPESPEAANAAPVNNAKGEDK
jgi:hypothetical protein